MATLAAGVLVPAASAARALDPDPSPAHWIAGGLKPDGFAEPAAGAARIVASAPALAPKSAPALARQPRAPAKPVELVRPRPIVPRQVVAPTRSSAHAVVATPAKHVPATIA